MIDRSRAREGETEQTGSRRGFLRAAGAVAVGASLAGCTAELESLAGDGGAEPTPAGPTATPAEGETAAIERAIHERVNEARRERDRGDLAFNGEIAAVARRYSRRMAEEDFFAHEAPDGAGPADRLDAFFPEHCQQIGENLAKVGRQPDADAAAVAERVVTGWLESPAHRENLLRGAFDEEGIGVATTGDGRVLATQHLCATGGILG